MKKMNNSYIRIPTLEDIHSISKYANNLEVCKFMIDFSYPYNKRQGLDFLRYAIDRFHKQQEYHFVIDMGGDAIGMIGLHSIDNGKGEISYRLGQEYWGKGIMLSSIYETIDFIKVNKINIKELTAKCNTQNTNSLRLLHKVGFKNSTQSTDTIYLSYIL